MTDYIDYLCPECETFGLPSIHGNHCTACANEAMGLGSQLRGPTKQQRRFQITFTKKIDRLLELLEKN